MSRSQLILAALVVSVGTMLYVPEPAEAWTNCYGNTHYHRGYNIPTKHVNTGRTFQANGIVYRVWDVKQDRNHDGNYKHVRLKAASCGIPA